MSYLISIYTPDKKINHEYHQQQQNLKQKNRMFSANLYFTAIHDFFNSAKYNAFYVDMPLYFNRYMIEGVIS